MKIFPFFDHIFNWLIDWFWFFNFSKMKIFQFFFFLMKILWFLVNRIELYWLSDRWVMPRSIWVVFDRWSTRRWLWSRKMARSSPRWPHRYSPSFCCTFRNFWTLSWTLWDRVHFFSFFSSRNLSFCATLSHAQTFFHSRYFFLRPCHSSSVSVTSATIHWRKSVPSRHTSQRSGMWRTLSKKPSVASSTPPLKWPRFTAFTRTRFYPFSASTSRSSPPSSPAFSRWFLYFPRTLYAYQLCWSSWSSGKTTFSRHSWPSEPTFPPRLSMKSCIEKLKRKSPFSSFFHHFLIFSSFSHSIFIYYFFLIILKSFFDHFLIIFSFVIF